MPSCFARSSISWGPSLLPASSMKYSDRVLDGTAANSLYKSSNRPLFSILSPRPTLLRCRLTCVSLSMAALAGPRSAVVDGRTAQAPLQRHDTIGGTTSVADSGGEYLVLGGQPR